MTRPEQTAVDDQPPAGARGDRRRLPAVGLPPARERRRGGAVVSFLIHALIIFLLLGPVAFHERDELVKLEQGAGGPGPAGGGGGGHHGTGGVQEHVAYVQPAPQPTAQPQLVVPPKPVPPPVPVVKPPDPVPVTPLPQIEEPKTEIKVASLPAVVPLTSLVSGVGGGSGTDGSRGNGPGSGGGIGSGIGTGRGSGVGPGTGGGTQESYSPTPISLFIAPMPVPKKMRGVTVTATFDIDSTGKVLNVDIVPKIDKDYDKMLVGVFNAFEFRPGTKADGTPIRMKFQVSYSF